jgi:hypothetical protein
MENPRGRNRDRRELQDGEKYMKKEGQRWQDQGEAQSAFGDTSDTPAHSSRDSHPWKTETSNVLTVTPLGKPHP